MNKDNKLLSPDASPTSLKSSGVKKVNNMPLIIVVSILGSFILLIAMVAMKKASAQKAQTPSHSSKAQKIDAKKLAMDLIRSSKPAPIIKMSPANTLDTKQEEQRIVYAPSLRSEALMPTVNNSEIDRINQEKTQLFEEAVKAKITVSVDKELIKSNGQDFKAINQGIRTGELSFKEQLKQLQAVPSNQSQTASIIGGKENEQRWRLNSSLQNPSTPFELRAGAVIPGVLISGLRSELNGQIIGQVSQDVFDTATGKFLIIPQGTKLIGIYSDKVNFGRDSVLVAWQRLVFPDGKALDIGAMPGADSAGYAGFRDEVDHHYARIYGSAVLMSGIVAAISYSQNRNQGAQAAFSPPSTADVLSQALGQQIGETTTQLIAKNINTAPTINIHPGYEFNVTVTKDLVFTSPYKQFAY